MAPCGPPTKDPGQNHRLPLCCRGASGAARCLQVQPPQFVLSQVTLKEAGSDNQLHTPLVLMIRNQSMDGPDISGGGACFGQLSHVVTKPGLIPTITDSFVTVYVSISAGPPPCALACFSVIVLNVAAKTNLQAGGVRGSQNSYGLT